MSQSTTTFTESSTNNTNQIVWSLLVTNICNTSTCKAQGRCLLNIDVN